MNIILCSKKDSVLKRWQSILGEDHWTVLTVSSLPMQEKISSGKETYLLLMHQSFASQEFIARFCRRPDTKVFILSDNPNTLDGIMLVKLGIVGYANTYISPARFREAVKTIMDGRVWFDHGIISKMIQSIKQGTRQSPDNEIMGILDKLTRREREIATLVADGLSNQIIAEKLFISERTVKSHLSSIFLKTGVQSRVKLALLLKV